MAGQLPLQATVIVQAEPATNQALIQMALFGPSGEPFVEGNADLADVTVMPNQAVFSGADVTALKVELNALRTKLINAGLMAAS